MGRKQGSSQYRNVELASRREKMVEPGRLPSKDETGLELPASGAAPAALDRSVERDGALVSSEGFAADVENEPNMTIKR